MKYDQFTSGQTIADTQDITDGNALISGLNIVMYPKRSNSIIVLEAHIHHSHSYVVSFGFIVNGTAAVSLSGNTNSSGSNVTQYHMLLMTQDNVVLLHGKFHQQILVLEQEWILE